MAFKTRLAPEDEAAILAEDPMNIEPQGVNETPVSPYQALLQNYRNLQARKKKQAEELNSKYDINAEDINNKISDYQKTSNDMALGEGLSNAAATFAGRQPVQNNANQFRDTAKLDIAKAENEQNLLAWKQQKAELDLNDINAKEAELSMKVPALEAAIQEKKLMDSPVDPAILGVANERLKKMNINIKLPEGMTQRQFEKTPFLAKLLEQSARDMRVQTRIIQNPDGSEDIMSIDPVTGQNMGIIGRSKQPASMQGINKGVAESQAIQGYTPAKVELASKEASAKAQATNEIKDKEATKEAQIGLNSFGVWKDRVSNLRKQARVAGPGSNLLRPEMWDAPSSELAASLSKNMSTEIKKFAGAAVSKQEEARLLKFLPTTTDTETEFNSKLAAMENELKDILRERQEKTGQVTSPVTSSVTSPVASPTKRSWSGK